MLRRRPSSPLESPGSQTLESEILTPYWGVWCDANNPGDVHPVVGNIPVSMSQLNDRVDSPRKTTVDASTLFGVREQASITEYQTNTRAAGSGEISGRDVSLSGPIRLLHYLLVDEHAPGGAPSYGSTHGPGTHPGNNAVPEPQTEGNCSSESAPAEPTRTKSRLVNLTGPVSSGMRKARL